ncbi:hypothetical protein PYCCODRAFT_1426754 [Trametes coccinea BRFM310]|uniref:Uncharacterized protein n=1 Tax=Trametes coccinea (strain BRFM310) TaxID=1353009 RepID=A0A1Y2IG79_TRAC3|nr:hypothetical protein PYCCODRAFT_1426754 [Trametes coccinea BRFM310]
MLVITRLAEQQALRKPSRAPVRGKKRRAEDSDSLHEKRAECVFFSSVVIVPSTAGWLLGLSSRVAALYAWCPRSKSRSRSRADWPLDARHARIPPNRPQSVGARFTHRPTLASTFVPKSVSSTAVLGRDWVAQSKLANLGHLA